jgi:hypothetical protein
MKELQCSGLRFARPPRYRSSKDFYHKGREGTQSNSREAEIAGVQVI